MNMIPLDLLENLLSTQIKFETFDVKKLEVLVYKGQNDDELWESVCRVFLESLQNIFDCSPDLDSWTELHVTYSFQSLNKALILVTSFDRYLTRIFETADCISFIVFHLLSFIN